jgi:hypothetical protein
MKITRNWMLATAILLCGVSSIFAQTNSRSHTYTNRRGGSATVTSTNNNGQISVTKTATSAYGRTASSIKAIDADPSDGTLSRTRVVTGPEGRSRTESGNAVFGNGTLSVSQQVTGRNGYTASRQATRTNTSASVTRINRRGEVYSRYRP